MRKRCPFLRLTEYNTRLHNQPKDKDSTVNNSTIAWKTRALIPLGEAEPAGAPSSTCTRDSTRCRSSSSMRSLPESSGRSCATEAGRRKPRSRRRTTDVSPAEGVPKGLATRGADAAGMGRAVVPRRRIAIGRAKRRGVLRVRKPGAASVGETCARNQRFCRGRAG